MDSFFGSIVTALIKVAEENDLLSIKSFIIVTIVLIVLFLISIVANLLIFKGRIYEWQEKQDKKDKQVRQNVNKNELQKCKEGKKHYFKSICNYVFFYCCYIILFIFMLVAELIIIINILNGLIIIFPDEKLVISTIVLLLSIVLMEVSRFLYKEDLGIIKDNLRQSIKRHDYYNCAVYRIEEKKKIEKKLTKQQSQILHFLFYNRSQLGSEKYFEMWNEYGNTLDELSLANERLKRILDIIESLTSISI